MNGNNSYAVVIPCYNHGAALFEVLARLKPFALATYVVDDGNDEPQRRLIAKAVGAFPGTTLVTLEQNGGKGRAFIEGAGRAYDDGFTHVVQLDADGQHAIEDLGSFIAVSKAHPAELVCADPVYDESAPKARLYGRRITNFWMAVETCSSMVKDGMCGLRVYPLKALLDCAGSEWLDLRMGFDIEILVYLRWRGLKMIFIKSPVTYPMDGVSNFHALRDNLRISATHTKLCVQALWRVPLMFLKGGPHDA